ncbi:SRPBCC domain-containing protein [Streptomyces kanamyceticus]|uniref:Carbon monoxide dehydrogenase subunit G n=1 Tax=Streptomyces kanamyceticus TaxID=1967 RepID=A0A5J6GCS2_STRKN|nr:SRPBCC domain-containing protein [Streptomyces kanamyceticus]QEU92953.1 carbon monoxide dehydrogenase subunit G [Streptomyces kanamyceticus]
MEHEVFVPVSAERLREVLADPERVAGAVPGLQRDAEETAEPISGRLKARVGGHSITYRGVARIDGRADGTYTIAGEGAEVRGEGSVKVALTVRLVPAVEGTTLVLGGTAAADGRIAESSPQAVESAVRKLLERFAEGLGAAAPPDSLPDPHPEAPKGTVFEAEVPPPSLDPLADDLDDLDGIEDAGDVTAGMAEDADELAGLDGIESDTDAVDIGIQPVEAAHARRTMIGRSAEEVDHAPPRGRYAPAPAPEAYSTSATLRWAAPAAALALASAIVVGRALRRRR